MKLPRKHWYLQQEVYLVHFLDGPRWEVIKPHMHYRFWTERGATKFIKLMGNFLVLSVHHHRIRITAQRLPEGEK